MVPYLRSLHPKTSCDGRPRQIARENRMRIVFGFIAIVCALSPALAQPAGQTTSSVAHAQALPARIPIEVDLQTAGGLRHADGVTVVVSLYAQRDSTDALWTEEQDVRPDDGGRVKLLAGASTDAGIP